MLSMKTNQRSQNVLSIAALNGAISLFIQADYIKGVSNYTLYYQLDIIDAFVTLLVIPLIYFFFKSLTSHSRFTWIDYLQFIPSLIVGTSTILLYTLMGNEDATHFSKLFVEQDSAISEFFLSTK